MLLGTRELFSRSPTGFATQQIVMWANETTRILLDDFFGAEKSNHVFRYAISFLWVHALNMFFWYKTNSCFRTLDLIQGLVVRLLSTDTTSAIL